MNFKLEVFLSCCQKLAASQQGGVTVETFLLLI